MTKWIDCREREPDTMRPVWLQVEWEGPTPGHPVCIGRCIDWQEFEVYDGNEEYMAHVGAEWKGFTRALYWAEIEYPEPPRLP